MFYVVLVLLQAYGRILEYEITHKVSFNIYADELNLGQITFGLFGKEVPKTVENFRGLCTGEYGYNGDGIPLSYENSIIHRVLPGVMIQGGDIISGNGWSGESIYGRRFRDEKFLPSHNSRGIITTGNIGVNANNSQYIILLGSATWLDKKSVIFGEVLEGIEVLDAIELLGSTTGKTSKNIRVRGCKEVIDN